MKALPSMFLALTCLAATPAYSQQLQQPTVPSSKPAAPPANSGLGQPLKQAQPASAPKVASDPNQRPQAPTAIPSTGPAQQVPTESKGPALRKPASLQDARGRPVNGMIQIAPNRVYDPATKRYHWTETSGDQQKILD